MFIRILIPLLLSTSLAYAEIPRSFNTVKKNLYTKVYNLDRTSFYCGCSFDKDQKLVKGSCNYQAKNEYSSSGKLNARATKVEAEHIVSVSLLYSNLRCGGTERASMEQCYSSSGKLYSPRMCCLRVNETFRKAHNDLVNVVPAIGEINAARVNKPFGVIPGEQREYGKCNVEIDKSTVEVHPSLNGDIARIYLYMLDVYGRDLGLDPKVWWTGFLEQLSAGAD